MTRKDYVALAEALHAAKPMNWSVDGGLYATQLNQWRKDTYLIANVCAEGNPRFDRERFVKACEGSK